MINVELSENPVNYEPVPSGSRLDMVLEGLDVEFALSALSNRPVVDDRPRRVIEMRFGLLNGEPKTIKEIARQFNRSQEVIRREEIEALITMRGIRNQVRPEMVFPRAKIYSIDNAYLHSPHALRKYGTKYPVPAPVHIYPEEK